MKILILRFSLALCWILIARAQEPSPQEEYVVAGVDPVTEVRLGKLYRDQALKKYPISENKEYVDIVNRVGNRIANSIGERPDLIDDWQFTVVKTDDVNAAAFGGGQVMVYEGLLKLMTVNGKIDEDMLASVLGHEMTHVVRRHVLLSLSMQGSLSWILKNLSAIESEAASGKLDQEQTNKLATLASARFTRVQEFEADKLGALFAVRAGYSGFDGALRWMQLVDQKLGDYSTEAYLPFKNKEGQFSAADHPTWKDRIAALLAYKDNILNLAGEFDWGYYLLQSYDLEKAAECFNDVTKIFPDSFEAWNNLGTAYHWMYLQQAGETEKFQPSLIDYFAPMRSQVRGESPLGKAIRCYQHALAINAIAKGTKANLAMALAATHDKENLSKAEGLLKEVLAAEPSNPSYLNDYAILKYWQQDANATNKAKQDEIRSLFQKAAGAGSLSAVYNLAMLQIDNGESEKGLKGLIEYLKRDSFSPWAKHVFALLQQRNVPTGNLATPSRPSVTNILGVKLGATPDEVAKVIGKPDRIETSKTSAQDSGQVFWYTTLGIGVVFSEGKAVWVGVFAPTTGDQFRQSGYAPQPEVAGVAIGRSFDDLRKTLGEPVSVRTDSKTGDNIYAYPCGEAILSFWVHSSVVYGITFTKAVPA